MKDEKVTIMSFYENWVELMEMCNPEEWYELCTIMTNLRFKGKDTNPKEIENIKIKMAWTLIRPSILKSNRNSRYTGKKTENKPILEQQSVEDNNTQETDLNTLEIDDMGNITNIIFNNKTGKFEDTNPEISNNKIESITSTPNVVINCSGGFEKVLKENWYCIKDIINDLKKDTPIFTSQANVRLSELLNRQDTKPYREMIIRYIEDRAFQQVA